LHWHYSALILHAHLCQRRSRRIPPAFAYRCGRSNGQSSKIADPQPVKGGSRWTVDFWSCPGSGEIAETLVRETSRFRSAPVAELGWYTRFSDAGRGSFAVFARRASMLRNEREAQRRRRSRQRQTAMQRMRRRGRRGPRGSSRTCSGYGALLPADAPYCARENSW